MKRKWQAGKWVDPVGEQVKRAIEVVFKIVGRGDSADDRDARDPRQLLPNGSWAPRGHVETYESLEDWRRSGR